MYQREGVFTNIKVLLHLSADFNLRPEAPDKLFFPLGEAPCIRCRNQLTTWSFKRAGCVQEEKKRLCGAGEMNIPISSRHINKSREGSSVHNSYLCHSIQPQTPAIHFHDQLLNLKASVMHAVRNPAAAPLRRRGIGWLSEYLFVSVPREPTVTYTFEANSSLCVCGVWGVFAADV